MIASFLCTRYTLYRTYQEGGISYTLGYVTEEDANNYLKVNILEEAIHMMKDKMLQFISSLDTMVLPEITAEDGTVTSGTLEVNGKVVTTPEELQAEVTALKTEMEQAMTIYDNILIDDANCPVLPSTSAFDELRKLQFTDHLWISVRLIQPLRYLNILMLLEWLL